MGVGQRFEIPLQLSVERGDVKVDIFLDSLSCQDCDDIIHFAIVLHQGLSQLLVARVVIFQPFALSRDPLELV